ncbi:AMP-dependent synthetase [Saccharomonospora piscinae]|uniref:AMP-dependent synthetase n=1 Tax=Saccharomonospora piscinae TaxID=687388 RepID=A0A1V9A1G6_SACPI|nr:o-succinylbenzoate--CoA ligase [Saccharomonospora piscinae]OQO90977.1 AMP-dependent synthetase [Saccharomonospora piscinae]
MRVVWVGGDPASVAELRRALLAALDGGPAVLPLDPRSPTAGEVRDALRPGEPVEADTAVVVPTSGSTGRPKGTLLSARALLASARATHARLGGDGRWLLATPACYVGGLQVLVRSRVAGTEPVVLDTSRGFRADAFAAAVRDLLTTPGPHYTALVPTQLARLLDAGGEAAAAAAALDAIVIGGAALPGALRLRAERAGIAVVASYGMSETAGGCVYDGVPLDGVRVRLGPRDRIEIAGPVLAHGYRLAPEPTAAAFRDGWFATGDVGRVSADGMLDVLGRLDDVVNTGGVKVAAQRVEDVLTGQDGVRAACVVGLPDPEWGQRVAAAVVTAGAVSPEVLRDAVRAELGRAAVPRLLRPVDTLPELGPGKVDRAAVRRLLADLDTPRARDAEE